MGCEQRERVLMIFLAFRNFSGGGIREKWDFSD
jgi:hypothetical protein